MFFFKLGSTRSDSGVTADVIKNPGKWLPAKAAEILTINGRVPKPHRVRSIRPPPGQECFLAELDRGRLRLQLSVPEGCILDPLHKTVSVKLYEPVFHE